MNVTARQCIIPDDVSKVQNLAQSIWSLDSQWHIGDIAWDIFSIPNRHDLMMVWEHGDRVLAWGWIAPPKMAPPNYLNMMVHPEFPELIQEVLDWFCRQVPGGMLLTEAMRDETHVIRALEGNGFTAATDEPFFLHMVRGLDDLPIPVLPAGFVARPIRGDGELDKRVAVHRAAFHPSMVTLESYRSVMNAPPYRPDLDWVIVAPNGEFASSCLVWLDGQHGVGEMEPVGTHPRYRRLGLARAVCLSALRSAKDMGATHAIVYARGDLGHPGPRRLYSSIGFRERTHTVTYIARV